MGIETCLDCDPIFASRDYPFQSTTALSRVVAVGKYEAIEECLSFLKTYFDNQLTGFLDSELTTTPDQHYPILDFFWASGDQEHALSVVFSEDQLKFYSKNHRFPRIDEHSLLFEGLDLDMLHQFGFIWILGSIGSYVSQELEEFESEPNLEQKSSPDEIFERFSNIVGLLVKVATAQGFDPDQKLFAKAQLEEMAHAYTTLVDTDFQSRLETDSNTAKFTKIQTALLAVGYKPGFRISPINPVELGKSIAKSLFETRKRK